MHYFAHLLLLALSPFTILARPRLAQTTFATSPVITAFNQACDVYVDAVELAQLAVPVCRKREDLSDCVEKATQQEGMETHINHANERLDFAAKHFKPKLPCTTIDSVFGKLRTHIDEFNVELRSFATDSDLEYVIEGKANEFRYMLDNQFTIVDDIGILFAKNCACNNPQSPAQLQDFAKKVEAVKNDDSTTARALADVAKKYRPGGSEDHLDITISIHGADSEIEL
ncbi:MAG: hypothetical protein L6R36_004521 [Xanthoria steineri]|nr:MAG: hypothetical protein L6R36_004521 [Xanthoria steineri]